VLLFLRRFVTLLKIMKTDCRPHRLQH